MLPLVRTVVATVVAASVTLPGVDVPWDYQIGGVRDAPARVGIVDRDRNAAPAGRYDVCYVNAFQTQADERDFWRRDGRGRLLLRHNGKLVVDGAWNEILLDIGTREHRRRLSRIVTRWIDGCAADGYEAVELDNLDSWTRSKGELGRRDARLYATRLARAAHAAGLAVAQKNAAELLDRRTDIGFDFAVVEECAEWGECRAFARAYSGRVLFVEYRRAWFRTACERVGSRSAVVLRDRDVSPDGPFRTC